MTNHQNGVLLETSLPGAELYARGKVRDIYNFGDKLLIVATDRISAFDYILQTGIPGKGRVLTQLSLFWFEKLRDVVANHLISAQVEDYPPMLHSAPDQLAGRSMLVHKASMIQVECVARGYLSGSGWKDYQSTGAICGISLPPGLKQSERLAEPLFTPATKAETGHDENIPFENVVNLIGEELAEKLRSITLRIYSRAAEYAETRGIIIADTKFEFGLVGDQLVLADEVLTPDSSRFWPVETYRAGGPQPSYDKQYVRDYLESIRWDKRPPAPALPSEVAQRTSEKYRGAYRALTGKQL
ncbi:MAG: phosphoribosylaminoimidazolesuccinocarboxamide synthase [Bryobacteraceae bacterium]